MAKARDMALDELLGSAPEAAEVPDVPVEGAAQGGGSDFDAGIDLIEASLASAPPDVAEKARGHLNALRELSAQVSGPAQPPAIPEPAGPEGQIPL